MLPEQHSSAKQNLGLRRLGFARPTRVAVCQEEGGPRKDLLISGSIGSTVRERARENLMTQSIFFLSST
jgi:hypothetical protein